MRIRANSIDIHYEVDGNGPPVILLHGNGEDHRIFDKLVDELKKEHEVFSIDSRGHGESSEVDNFHYSDMAEDVVSFIKELKINKPLLYGFSDGGVIGIMLTAEHPELLSGLIASGVNLTPKDLKLWFRSMIKIQYTFKRDPMLKLMLDEPNISEEELRKIKIPVLITVAEKDIVTVSHAKFIADTIHNGRLIVVPKEDHGSYIIHSEKLFPLISDFIKEAR